MTKPNEYDKDWHKIEWAKSGLSIEKYAERQGIPKDTIYKWSSAGKWQEFGKRVKQKSETKAEERLSDKRATLIASAQKEHLTIAKTLLDPGKRGLLELVKAVNGGKRKLTIYETLALLRAGISLQQATLGLRQMQEPGSDGGGPTSGEDLGTLTPDQLAEKRSHFERVAKAGKPKGDHGNGNTD